MRHLATADQGVCFTVLAGPFILCRSIRAEENNRGTITRFFNCLCCVVSRKRLVRRRFFRFGQCLGFLLWTGTFHCFKRARSRSRQNRRAVQYRHGNDLVCFRSVEPAYFGGNFLQKRPVGLRIVACRFRVTIKRRRFQSNATERGGSHPKRSRTVLDKQRNMIFRQ